MKPCIGWPEVSTSSRIFLEPEKFIKALEKQYGLLG